jgi:hypothetical protein
MSGVLEPAGALTITASFDHEAEAVAESFEPRIT